MIDFLLDHVISHPLAIFAGVLLGALVPGVKLWFIRRAAQAEALAKQAASRV